VSAVEELADGWEAAWSGRDPAAFGALCAADVHYEDPLTVAPLRGPGAIGEHAAALWRAFPDVLMRRSGERLAGGRFVALPVEVLGTNVGPLGDLPPSGSFVSAHVVFWCELDGARQLLWRVRGFFDLYDAGTTLGVLPRPGSVRQRVVMMLQGYGLRLGR
jgi:hypothetical protein